MKAAGMPKRRVNPKAARYRMRIGRPALHRYGMFALEEIPAGRRRRAGAADSLKSNENGNS